jgi:hypothetical protein
MIYKGVVRRDGGQLRKNFNEQLININCICMRRSTEIVSKEI